MVRGALARVLRNSTTVYEGKIASLKRFKDDVKEALTGFECGIQLENLMMYRQATPSKPLSSKKSLKNFDIYLVHGHGGWNLSDGYFYPRKRFPQRETAGPSTGYRTDEE
jgi:bacterial translation initiation factor 2 (bIF-2)